MLISQSWGDQTQGAGLHALQKNAALPQHCGCMYFESHVGSQSSLHTDSPCIVKSYDNELER